MSFKRTGEPVPSPVDFGLSPDGKLYVRSEPKVAKVRRIKNDPHVLVCPCNLRGKPLGPLATGTARVLPESEAERAHAIIAANWDPFSRIFERSLDLMRTPLVYIEITHP